MTVTHTPSFIVEDKAQDDLKKIFETYGLLVLRHFIDPHVIKDLQSDVIHFTRKAKQDGQDIHKIFSDLDREDKDRLYKLYSVISYVSSQALVEHQCSWLCQQLISSGPGVMCIGRGFLIGLPKDERLTYDWHQESNFFQGFPGVVLNFWFPVLDPSTKENGAMSILVGSHKEGRLGYLKKTRERGYTELIPKDIEQLEKKYEEFHCECPLGDVVVFHPDTIHRSNFNTSGKTRISGVFRMAIPTEFPEKLSWKNTDY